mgnify:CR=1 FL=1
MKSFEEIFARIERARALMPENVGGILITSEINRFYFTDLKYTDSALLITRDGAYSFADFRHDGLLRDAVGDVYTIIMPEKEGLYSAAAEVCRNEKITSVLYESMSVSVDEHAAITKAMEGIKLIPAGTLFLELRTVKSEYEISKMKEAQKLTDEAFAHILPLLNTNITENEVALELEFFMRKRGASGVSFDYICVSGKESAKPHGQGRNVPLEKGFFTMDFGCIYDGYMSDMTRTVSIGTPTDEMKKVYDTVLKAHLAVAGQLKAGMTGKEADTIARDIINGAGYEGYFGHSLGHGVGIEIHEQPNLSQRNVKPLPVGAVVTNEPGIYLPDRFGVRIENMLYLTKDGVIDLTGAPRELIVI